MWVAEEVALKRKVALKIVLPERFESAPEAYQISNEREAQTLAYVNSSLVPHVYSVGKNYISMEWIRGEPLSKEIEHNRRAIRRRLKLIAASCRALESVHAFGVVHRDVKPANLIVAKNDRVVLIDFGLSRRPDGTGTGGYPIGTPRYLAPEAATSSSIPLPQYLLTDIYSLGCIAYELLAGSPPFPGDRATEVIEKHRFDAPEPPSKRKNELPSAVDSLILKALEKNPSKRYQSCREMHDAIQSFLKENQCRG